MKAKCLLLFAAGTLLLSGCSKVEKLAKYENKVSNNEEFFQKLEKKVKSHEKLNDLKTDSGFKNPFSYSLTSVSEESSKTKVFKDGKKLYKDQSEKNAKKVLKYNHKEALYSLESKTEIERENPEEETESSDEYSEIYQVDSEYVYTFMPDLKVCDKEEIKEGKPKEYLKNYAMSKINDTVNQFYETLEFSKELFEKKIGYLPEKETHDCKVDKNEFYVDKNNSVFTIVLECSNHKNWDEYKVKDVYQLVIENDKVLFVHNSDVKQSRDNKKVVKKTRSSNLVKFDDPKINKQDVSKYLLIEERDK